MKSDQSVPLRTLLLSLIVSALSLTFVACEPDNGGGIDVGGSGDDTDETTSFVAVTGSVGDFGCTYADISGYANLHLLPEGSDNPAIGVELVEADAESNANAIQSTSRVLSGNKFSVSFLDLSPSTSYKYRSFVTNGEFTYYGEKYNTFTTKSIMGLTFANVSSDVKRTSAVLHTSVYTDSVDLRDDYLVGFAWSPSESEICAGGEFDSCHCSLRHIKGDRYSASLNDLSEGTTYYYASFTELSGLYVFSSVKSFTTGVLTNLVGDVEVSDITRTSAVLSAVVQTAGVAAEDNLQVGLAWSTSESDLCVGGKYESIKTSVQDISDGRLSASLSELTEGTTYYYASFTESDGAYVFSSVKSFTTGVLTNLVGDVEVSDITRTSAVLSAVVQTAGVAAEDNLHVGLAWSTSESALCAGGKFESIKTSVQDISDGRLSASLSELTEGTTYYYASFTESDGAYVFSSVKSFTTSAIQFETGAVDLGLSVKWAGCNVGAESPEEYGDYFAWGEIEEKSNYSWSTYKWCNGSYDSQTKYCTSSSYGKVDNKTTLDPEDDVAHVQWGGNWRMPTLTEMQELRNNCSWSWISVNGIKGYQVTGPNGNSIFLPATGYRNGEDVYGHGTYGHFWSATVYESSSGNAYCLYFSDGAYSWDYRNRNNGRTVRPVYGTPQLNITVTTGDASAITANSATLGGTVSGSSKSVTCGIIYGTSSSLSSTSGTKKSTTSSGSFSVDVTDLSPSTTYYYCAYVVVDEEYKYGEVRSFTTAQEITVTTGDASAITTNSATLGGAVSGSDKSVACGIIYGTSSTLSSTSGTKKSTTSSGSFSVDVTDLSPSTTYYYCAYVVVDEEYKYGEVRSFTTAQEITVTTGDATAITANSATLGGAVSGSDKSVTCGIIYGTSSTLSSTSGTKKSTTSSGSFSVDVTDLSPSTTYYYCAYVVVDEEYKYGEVRSFTTEADISVTEGDVIDLGLSVKWASCNVGAQSPEDYGGYYAWGETKPKSSYTADNSLTCGLSISELQSRGIIGTDGNLTAAYDAATANWGGDWRMPTLDEIKELQNNCTWEWTTQNGVKGRKVIGPNGNSIFLPAAGCRMGASFYYAGSSGYYWSAMPYSSSSLVYYLSFGSDSYGWNYDGRSGGRGGGHTVRPVYGVPQLNITVSTGNASAITTNSATLGGTVSGSSKSVTCGIIYGTSSTLSSTSGTKKSTTSSGSFSIDVTDLSPSTTYYYCAYVVVDEEYKYGEVRSFTTEADISVTEGDVIDLGLSVKWASCNVGAQSPEDYGGYYAWGETKPKSSYTEDNSLTYGLSTSELQSRGIIGADGNLTAAYDAATANLGGNWRMPTLIEMKELINNCTWEWTTMNGVNGRKVTGPNGNSIFLPSAGYYRNDSSLYDVESDGLYWSATPYSSSYSAYYLIFGLNHCGWDYLNRCFGQVVRPVYGTPQLNITVSTGNASAITTNSATLGGAVSGSDKSVTCGIIYGTSSTLSSTSGTKKSTTSSGSFSVDVTGLSSNTTYYYRAYVVVDGEYKYGDILSFTTEALPLTAGEAIDLGLSVKWANYNVGARSPEDYGGYYAWGETKPKSSYTEDNSLTYDLSTSELQSRGIIGADGNLTAAYDAATANWGGNWRMPTKAEQDELHTECTWSLTSVNGVNGYRVTGPNGNSIFLPAAGYRYGEGVYDRGTGGDYWSASLSSYYYSGSAYYLQFFGWGSSYRYYGRSVRPVYGAPQLNITVSTGNASAITTKSATLGGTVSGSSKSVTCGIIYGTSSSLSSTSSTKKSTTSSGSFSVDVTGLSSNTTYYYRAYVVVDGEYKYGDILSFTTEALPLTAGEAIDLGLSVKWANYNVGARSPEDYGGYYAWGETKPKSSYTEDNSVTYGLSISELESRGIIDSDGNLTAAYDAATVNWGENWRMPTEDEMKELKNNCTWEWTTMNGVEGRKVTGPNGNSIFLPAVGIRYDESLSLAGSDGKYWSATPFSNSIQACYLRFTSGKYGYYYGDPRYYGFTVRPVSE